MLTFHPKRGFTLIELLVVIAIIGILASIVLASLGSARAKGRDAKRVSDIKQIQLALELYYDQNSQYPTGANASALTTLVTNNFISAIPTDPDGTAYKYTALQGAGASAATCGSYHLGATLESSGNTALQSDTDGQLNGTYGAAVSNGTSDGSPTCNSVTGTDFSGNTGVDTIFDVRP